MNPAFLDNMSYEMAEVYGAISDQILINLAKYFPFIDNGKIPRSSFQYQAAMLAQMGQVNRETIKIIASGLKGADEALQGVLQQAIIDAVKKVEPELVKAVRRGLLQPTGIPVVAPNQMRAFQLYYQQAAEKMNLVNTVMLESTKSAYTQAVAGVVSELQIAERIAATQTALDIGAGELVTGAASFNQAMRHATDRLKQHGITGFIDHAGRQWSAEAYVAMDMRTTVFNTGRAAVWETNQDFGNDLYIVSYHQGARPLCYPWQNKVISSTDNARTVTDLDGNEIHAYAQSETSYGEAAGLFGINCQHYPDPFIPGVSVIHGEPQSKEENDRVYAESQEQRRLERKVREEKRDLEMLKAQGASKEEIAAQREKVREASTRVQDFCDETGRTRHRDREAVYTSREFPDKERYDVEAFERKQKETIDQYFTGGGAQQGYTFGQMTPNEPIVPATPAPVEQATTPVATFTPAKTIAEAEEYAKSTFVDTDMWASHGVSLKGISLDSANAVNQRLAEFYGTYKVDKFSSLVAPAGNTKLGKAIQGGHAGFNPMNRAMILNRNSLNKPGAVISSLAQERQLVADYLANPEKYPGIKPTSFLGKMLEASRTSGRFSVPTTLEEIIDHECGHALERALKGVSNYETIVANMSTFAPGISGYAQDKFGEYIAESFCAWRKGETCVDPELIKGFLELRR